MSNLIAELQKDVLSDKPLNNCLRKCVVLGGQLGSVELREWASRELRGYDDLDFLPPYRRVLAPLMISGMNVRLRYTGHQITRAAIPESMREYVPEDLSLMHGIGEIEAMVSNATDGSLRMGHPGFPNIVQYWNHELGSYESVTELYWLVSVSALQGVIDQVRTTLAELVAELDAGTPRGEELPPLELATQAVHVAVNGAKSRVTVTSAQAGGGSQSSVCTNRRSEPSGLARG